MAQIHEAYTAGDYSAEQLVGAYLERIEALDQTSGLNTIVVLNPNALEEARSLDLELRTTGTLRPLHGIPMIVKDNYNTIGLQTAAGSVALKDFTPETDAFQVRKLKEARRDHHRQIQHGRVGLQPQTYGKFNRRHNTQSLQFRIRAGRFERRHCLPASQPISEPLVSAPIPGIPSVALPHITRWSASGRRSD